MIDNALPLLSAAAGSTVTSRVGSHNPLAAVQDALNLVGFDEVIVSMLPAPFSRWLRLDLPSKLRAQAGRAAQQRRVRTNSGTPLQPLMDPCLAELSGVWYPQRYSSGYTAGGT